MTRKPSSLESSRAERTKGNQRLEEVLDAAEEILKKHGAEGLSVREVAQKVGISVGNLQYYLPTRAKLLDAVFRRHAEVFKERLDAAIESIDDPERKFSALLDVWLASQFQADQALFWHLWAISAHDREAQDTMTSIYDEFVDFVSDLLQQLNPLLTANQSQRQAAVVTSMIEGSGLFVGYGRTPKPIMSSLQEDIRNAVLDFVGFSAHQRRGHTARRKDRR